MMDDPPLESEVTVTAASKPHKWYLNAPFAWAQLARLYHEPLTQEVETFNPDQTKAGILTHDQGSSHTSLKSWDPATKKPAASDQSRIGLAGKLWWNFV